MLEHYFSKFRKNIIGIDQTFETVYGVKKIVYADWTASGRLYGPIEHRLSEVIGPFVGNTHTGTSITGASMTQAYHKALHIIKRHVGGKDSDVIIASGSGMTGVVNKFQRILGMRFHENFAAKIHLTEAERPVVFCTHMEHHSNQTSWLETIAIVEIIQADEEGLVDLKDLEHLLEKHKDRKTKIAAVTSCSNVSGVFTPYHQIAEIMHRHGGLCFVDFACSAPYIDMNMHPENDLQRLDALYFSPHKFLGGPGSPGILVFDAGLYHNKIPDQPGGGTVDWTNPWGQHRYVDEIEQREDGGTPAFLQTIKAALCVKLKDEMGVENILAREHELKDILLEGLEKIPNLHVLADQLKDRLGVISFYIDHLHYNLAVKLLNDRFGIQSRGGCSCAGSYGHFLLHVTPKQSKTITNKINKGDLSLKPGWVRISIHPTLTNEEIRHIVNALEQLALHHKDWAMDYVYSGNTNEFEHKDDQTDYQRLLQRWFETSLT